MKTGRNDPCHCGSGLKHKKCCAEKDAVQRGAEAAEVATKAAAEPAADAPTSKAKAKQSSQGDWMRQPRPPAPARRLGQIGKSST